MLKFILKLYVSVKLLIDIIARRQHRSICRTYLDYIKTISRDDMWRDQEMENQR